ncbi:MAG: HAMP domain-containing protein [Chitinivibrionales bacterium]|nr:HAMP domain-containing protein [Chitinivibrionales bacterium]
MKISHFSLKAKTFLLLIFIVLLATAPLIVYYVKTAQSLAELATDEQVEQVLRDAVDVGDGQELQNDAVLALRKYRQTEALWDGFLRHIMRVSIAYFIGVIIIALVIGYWFIERITKPLANLTNATQRLASGKLDFRIEESCGGEIGQLVRSFNTMADNLETARQEKIRAERKATWQRVARIIAHEIKNPLTPIKLSTERMYEKYLMDSKDFPVVIKSTASTILSEIDNLQKLVDTFHKYAKFPDPQLQPTHVNEAIREACALFDAHDSALTCSLQEAIPRIQIDRAQIREALTNLIKNAHEAILENGKAGTIELTSRCEGSTVVVSVKDNGCGIADEHREKLFQPYFTTKEQGNGIGLALTERIISLHGGTIECTSAVRRGTEFIISLPI